MACTMVAQSQPCYAGQSRSLHLAARRAGGREDGRTVGMADEVYGAERIAELRKLLRALAERILELDRSDRLLAQVPELLRRLGDLRSELFHYEVRATYDTPEIAEHRRLVEEAREQRESLSPDPEDDEPWRHLPPQEHE